MQSLKVALLSLAMVGMAVAQPPEPDPRTATVGPGFDTGLKRITLRQISPPAGGPNPSFIQTIPSDDTIPDPALGAVNPATYRLAPGDLIEVNLHLADVGAARRDNYRDIRGYDRRRKVDVDGSLIVVQDLSLKIPVAGLRLAEAEQKARRVLSRYYRNFNLTLSLLYVRRYPVQVVGEVQRPGTYTVTGVTGAAQAVLEAGGLNPVGSMRRVTVMGSGNKPIRVLDFLKWQQLGDQTQNPELYAQQTVVVPAVDSEVSFNGQVVTPGIYEILPGETIGSLARLAGGFTNTANLGQVQVGRLQPNGQRTPFRLDLATPGSQDWNFALERGDEIQVNDLTIAQKRVVVIGELASRELFVQTANQSTTGPDIPLRAIYPIREGETLREMVLALGGTTAKADMEHSWIERAGPEGELLKIPVNLRKLIIDNQVETQDVALQDGDVFVVPALPDSVFVAGHVFHPGPIPYRPGFGLREYVASAGGTPDTANTNHARLIRQVPGDLPVVYEFNLLEVMEEGAEPVVDIRPGDVIYVPLWKPWYGDFINLAPSLLYLPSLIRNP